MENEAIFNNDRQPPLRGDNVLVGGCRRPQKNRCGECPRKFISLDLFMHGRHIFLKCGSPSPEDTPKARHDAVRR